MVRLLAVLVLAGTSVKAQTYTSGDWQYSLINSTARIERYIGTDTEVTFPSEVDGYQVDLIGGNPSLFSNSSLITKIVIPDGVREIGFYSFAWHVNLTNVVLPITLTKIGQMAFQGCQRLTEINLPQSLQLIEDGAFANTGLTTVSIPNSVTNIGPGAFMWSTNLTHISIPEGVTKIGGSAFAGTAITNITIPLSVTNLSGNVFYECWSLTNLNLPPKFLGDSSFLGLTGPLAMNNLVQALSSNLATNSIFLSNLAQAILAASNNYGLATQSGVSNIITATTSNLATKTELTASLAQSRTDGINSVLSNPNLWTLYTTNQIHAMAIGDLVLTSTNNGQFVLNYDIEQSEDLVNWTPYQGFAMPLTNLPTNKAFVRIKAKQ